jgi:hypothetical protein
LNGLAAASFDLRAAIDSLKSPRIGAEAEIE